MLFSGAKKEAFAIHERAVSKYNTTLANVQKKCEELYVTRQQCVIKIEEIERLINSIANTPKEFECSLSLIKTERMKFRETESYAAEAYQNAIKSGVGVAASVGAGAAVASLAPTAAMWVATTFGTASTGTAISTLSGAVATKAALAWLGGGALTAGGAGVAGGQALLALAGPIGWGITAFTTAGSVVALGSKNKKISNEAIEEAKEITIAGAKLNETGAVVSNIHSETKLLLDNIKEQLSQANPLEGCDYSAISSDEQLLLGTLVNNTLSLAVMLNKTVA
ncbi:hypothetical protein [Marasmitruncus massiliensis]|uniref:hypothetical protein n=1 Tax=Marasmitruncus massiliensis TaxID=1944642 RepID=UPI000C79B023|nr:hypothetical protein [Marasmitruncus massiliensis]